MQLNVFSIFISTFFLKLILPNHALPLLTDKSTAIKWSVEKSSTLRILGSSNIHDFQCEALGYTDSDTLVLNTIANNIAKQIPLSGNLKIDIKQINCHNFIITRNFRATLKADLYPYLIVKFLSLERSPHFTNNKDQLIGLVEIELAGVAKKFEIPYKLQKNGALVILNGQRNFTFSDFDILTPTILGGLVKINNSFNVGFNLCLKQTI